MECSFKPTRARIAAVRRNGPSPKARLVNSKRFGNDLADAHARIEVRRRDLEKPFASGGAALEVLLRVK